MSKQDAMTVCASRVFRWLPFPHWRYTLLHPYVYPTGIVTGEWFCRGPLTIDQGGCIYIEDGYAWDGETGVVDVCLVAGLVHDVLYEHCIWSGGPLTRAQADALYRRIYHERGCWAVRRLGDVRWTGVRVVGGAYHAVAAGARRAWQWLTS